MSNELILAANPALPAVTDFRGFIALARDARPPLFYASIGNGSEHHLAMELLKQQAGIDLVHVPYRGGGPAAIGVMAGDVAAMFGGGSVAPLVQAGKLKGLAVSGQRRSRLLPDLPAIADTYPGYDVTIWQGLFAPVGTPPAIVARLREEMNAILAQPDIVEKLAVAGSGDPYVTTLAELAAQRSRALRQADQGRRPRGGLMIVRGSCVAGAVAAAMSYDPATSADRRIFMHKHSCMLTVCLVVCLFTAAPVRAQTPSPDTIAAARELLVTMGGADQIKTTMAIVMKNLKPAIVQNRLEVERDFDAMLPLILESFNARMNEVIDQIAAVYARTFTADELREAVAFYRGPTGQKIVQKLPALLQESMAVGQRFGQSIGNEFRGRMIEELRKRGHNI